MGATTGNTAPIFSGTPKNGFAKVTGVDGGTDGTDADVVLLYTAGSDGAFINFLNFQPRATSGSTTTSVAVGRIYINNGSTVGTGTNNVLFREVTLPATAVNVAGTTPALGVLHPMNIQIQSGYRIYIGVTAMAANTSWDVTAISGDY